MFDLLYKGGIRKLLLVFNYYYYIRGCLDMCFGTEFLKLSYQNMFLDKHIMLRSYIGFWLIRIPTAMKLLSNSKLILFIFTFNVSLADVIYVIFISS